MECLEIADEVTIVMVVLPYHLRYLILGMLEFTTIVNSYSPFQLAVLPRVRRPVLSFKASKV